MQLSKGGYLLVKIHMMKALEGDFIWLSYGSNDTNHHVLIDGGVKTCGEKYAELINKIANMNQSIEAIVLTHIDCDHIAGACEGIAKIKADVLKRVVKKIIFNASEEIHKEILVTNSFGGYSVKDGIQFLKVLEEKGIKDRLISRVLSGDVIKLEDDAIMKIISPGKEQFLRLLKEWEKYEKKHDVVGYMSNTEQTSYNLDDLKNVATGNDSSINNMSSIAFLFEYKNVRGAFLGDSISSVCKEGLKKQNIEETYVIDFIKLSHHGSMGNIDLKLLELLCTDNYLLSTNGHGKKVPAKTTIAKLVRNCEEKDKNKISLFCNYKWWENVYHNTFFTHEDKQKYLDTQKLEVHLLEKNGLHIKDGLILYGNI